MGFEKGNKLGGRKKGAPNKATADARAAIGLFVDGNAHRLQSWLDAVAEGMKDDKGEFVVAPDPVKAFGMFQSIIEYHVPKLERVDHTGSVENRMTFTLDSADAKA